MVTINIGKICQTYKYIETCKLTKLSDEDKMKMWKILKAFKPIYEKFDNAVMLAAEKFKPENYDSLLEKAKAYENMHQQPIVEGVEFPMTDDEYDSFILKYQSYINLVSRAADEYCEKDKELDIELLSEQAFGGLISSNDWPANQVLYIGDVLVSDIES